MSMRRMRAGWRIVIALDLIGFEDLVEIIGIKIPSKTVGAGRFVGTN
jgi:hypothetical protein